MAGVKLTQLTNALSRIRRYIDFKLGHPVPFYYASFYSQFSALQQINSGEKWPWQHTAVNFSENNIILNPDSTFTFVKGGVYSVTYSGLISERGQVALKINNTIVPSSVAGTSLVVSNANYIRLAITRNVLVEIPDGATVAIINPSTSGYNIPNNAGGSADCSISVSFQQINILQ